MCWACAPSAPSSCASRSSAGRSAASPTTYSSFQLHASSSVGAILVIAQWGRGAGRIQDSPLHSISGLIQVNFAINEESLFNVEYADVLGIPFDFTAKPMVAPPQPPRETIQVRAVRPERDHLEIRFPRVAGYRVELPEDKLTSFFSNESRLILDPRLVGPSI